MNIGELPPPDRILDTLKPGHPRIIASDADFDRIRELAARVLRFGLSLVPAAMAHYAPNGGYREGPMYWKYGTRYNIYYIAALESALGTDFGLHKAEGFSETGFFTIHMLGPSGKTFNFADAPDRVIADPGLFWLAERFGHPEYAEYQAVHTPGEPLDLVWYRPDRIGLLSSGDPSTSLCSARDDRRGKACSARDDKSVMPSLSRHLAEGAEGLPLDSYFPYVEVVTMRSGWDDNALFIGFKAGNNQFNHGNLDMGSFVLDALGERWAMDPGREEYNLPGYWDRTANGQRWTYYRERAEGHNTLVINPSDKPDQDPMAQAEIVEYAGCGGGPPLSKAVAQALALQWPLGLLHGSSLCPTATADLTPAYAGSVTLFKRRISLTGNRSRVAVHDEVHAPQPVDIWWFMHTEAEIEVSGDGRVARLKQNGKQLAVRIVAPENATFSVMPAAPLPTSPNPGGQNPNDGMRKLAIHFEETRELELTVRFKPHSPRGQA